MLIFHTVDQFSGYLLHLKHQGQTTGFAPTMGALHQGHLSLLEAAKKHCDKTVFSIFVNPTQFNNPSDFEKYPVTIAADLRMLELAGCDILFLPSVADMYPSGTEQRTDYELGFLEMVLEGSSRPGHFQGVCMVMDRLLSIVMPNDLFMGLKDYQQCMVVKRLLELKGWKDVIQFHACPTLREVDGLAMSSRNLRLSKEQRKTAPAIYECLQHIKQNLQPGPLQPIKQKACELLEQKGFRIDYVAIADASSLELIQSWNGNQSLIALIAVFLGDVRLIDNMPLTPLQMNSFNASTFATWK